MTIAVQRNSGSGIRGRMVRMRSRVGMATLKQLLVVFGINPKRYDLKDREQRAWALQEAEEVFRRRMKEAHPDVGGDEAHAADLASVMNRIRELVTRPKQLVPATRVLGEAVCPVCGQPFPKRTLNQRLCSRDCTHKATTAFRMEKRAREWSDWSV